MQPVVCGGKKDPQEVSEMGRTDRQEKRKKTKRERKVFKKSKSPGDEPTRGVFRGGRGLNRT